MDRLLPVVSRPAADAGDQVIDLRPAEADERHDAQAWPDDDRPRILVVDDEPDIREWLRVALGVRGWHVNAARSASEGLEMALRLHPDIVLLDQRLPDGTGLEVGRTLRDERPDLRLLMFSAYLDLPAEEEAEALGIRTISKVDRAALFATLDAMQQEITASSQPAS